LELPNHGGQEWDGEADLGLLSRDSSRLFSSLLRGEFELVQEGDGSENTHCGLKEGLVLGADYAKPEWVSGQF